MKINERIRNLREDADLTQTDMGNILNVNQITVSQYERGTRQVPNEIIYLYAKHFNVSTDYIFGLTNDIQPHWNIKNQVNITGKNKIHKIEIK